MKLFTKILICAILAAVLVAPSFAASKAPTDGLVIYYDFEEAGTVVKDTVGKNNFEDVDASRFVDGYKGKALSFNGTNDQILHLMVGERYDWNQGWTLASEITCPNPNKSFSVSAWIKSEFKADGAVFCWGSFAGATGTWAFVQADSSNVCLANVDGSFTNYGYAWNSDTNLYGEDATRVDDNQWHNVVFVYDSAQQTAFVYIDGKLYHENPVKEMVVDPFDNYFYVGGRSADSPFNGLIDELRIYNRAVTADEVATLAEIGAANTSDYTAIAVLAAAVCGAVLVLRKKH
ncbi:MAG: LamG domain-containing protein [Clostridia bacterium]|nr:LamG domain-containing protein [Clostridia bacterium]